MTDESPPEPDGNQANTDRDQLETPTPEILRQRLRSLKEAHGLSQRAMANLLGMTHGAYQRRENGKTRIDAQFLAKVAALFGCDLALCPLPQRDSDEISASALNDDLVASAIRLAEWRRAVRAEYQKFQDRSSWKRLRRWHNVAVDHCFAAIVVHFVMIAIWNYAPIPEEFRSTALLVPLASSIIFLCTTSALFADTVGFLCFKRRRALR